MLGITELTYTALISFLIVVILGPIFIPMLTKFKFGQTVRDDGPKTHLAKNGTPTMGPLPRVRNSLSKNLFPPDEAWQPVYNSVVSAATLYIM